MSCDVTNAVLLQLGMIMVKEAKFVSGSLEAVSLEEERTEDIELGDVELISCGVEAT